MNLAQFHQQLILLSFKRQNFAKIVCKNNKIAKQLFDHSKKVILLLVNFHSEIVAISSVIIQSSIFFLRL